MGSELKQEHGKNGGPIQLGREVSFPLLPEMVINSLSALSREAGAGYHAINIHIFLSSEGKSVHKTF